MHQQQHDISQRRQCDAKQTSPLQKPPKSQSESLKMLKSDPTRTNDGFRNATIMGLKPVEDSVVGISSQEAVAQVNRQKSISLNTSSRSSGQEKTQMKSNQHDKIASLYHKSSSQVVDIPACLLKGTANLQQTCNPVSRHPFSGLAPMNPYALALDLVTPPVNKETLKELELSSIQNNLTLRIDLVYDQGLYFQPISGSRGQEKQKLAKAYWEGLSLELKAYIHGLRGDCEVCVSMKDISAFSRPSQLLILFSTLQELLEMLVPEAERAEVRSRLEVEFYVRLVRTGQFEAGPFAQWLSKLITTHCAPMRDQMARDMHRKIAEGAESGDMETLVSGLSLLFNLLEKMKLDVANHQIRTFKYLLITDAVPFLQDCYSKMIKSNQFDLSGTTVWFQQSLAAQEQKGQVSSMVRYDQYFEAFTQGVVDLSKTSADEPPAIFMYDKERLDALRNDMIDVIQWQICEDTLRELTQKFSQRQPTAAEIEQCSKRVLQLIMPESSHNEGIDCHLKSVALQIARTAAGMNSEEITCSQDRYINDDQFNEAYHLLEANLCERYAATEEQHFQTLSKLVQQHAHHFNKMTTLQVSDAQKAWAEKRSTISPPRIADLEDIARRTAHIAVLSWQIWADMAFLDPPDLTTI